MQLSIKTIVLTIFTLLLFLNTITLPPVLNTMGELTYPGVQSTDLDDLHSSFQSKLNKTINRLEKEGYPVWVGATWRSKERQQFYKDKGYSTILNSLHRGGKETKGKRRAKAADIYLYIPMLYLPLHAKFYHRLSEIAKQEGLCTGATFEKRNPLWGFYDLGWDPGHVQIQTSSCQ
jgi:hypothetical protein